jgi:DNA primase
MSIRKLSRDVSRVLTETNILNLIAQHVEQAPGTQGRKQRQYHCPFHSSDGETDHKFTLTGSRETTEAGWFRCMSCASTGNAIDFLMQYHGYTLEKAVATLMKINGGGK